jgi:predicted nucleotidyltransferase
MENDVHAVVRELASRLEASGVADALWVGGSLATGDYVPGVSDLDLVAVTSERLMGEALAQVAQIHEELDAGLAYGMDLGCQYADAGRLVDVAVEHPTWTHGEMLDRTVSLVTRAELVLHGLPLLGPPPDELLPPVTPDGVRDAARAELTGYWSYAARRPRLFWRLPVMVDLSLTAMARARHALAYGELLTKSAAIEQARAPRWLKDDLRARRRGEQRTSPRLRASYVAWGDVRRTTSAAGRSTKRGK